MLPFGEEPLWSLQPYEFTMAVAFVNESGKSLTEIENYVNMYFYEYEKKDGGVNHYYYRATPCK